MRILATLAACACAGLLAACAGAAGGEEGPDAAP